jgi:hypothetical protein
MAALPLRIVVLPDGTDFSVAGHRVVGEVL